MSGKKIRVGILFGGRSAEHEVSLQSAKSVLEALDRDKYEPVLIGIDKRGRWHLNDASRFVLNADDPRRIQMAAVESSVALLPWNSEECLVTLAGEKSIPTQV